MKANERKQEQHQCRMSRDERAQRGGNVNECAQCDRPAGDRVKSHFRSAMEAAEKASSHNKAIELRLKDKRVRQWRKCVQ